MIYPFHTRSDLLKSGGKFKINSNFIDNDDADNIFPELETGEEIPDDAIPSPWQFSFNELRALMKPLPPPHQTIYRKLICEGTGPKYVAAEKSRLTIHYSGYWEHATQPFDSTFLQGQPIHFHPGQQEILLGIELAVLSMRVGEESQFVIPYQMLFGELGCPERIQPRADGLFSIQLLKITAVGDKTAVDEISAIDRTKFNVVFPKAKDVYTHAKDSFARHDFNAAVRLFHKAVNSLECCKLANEAEQREQQDFLLKIYINLAVCYNKLDLPKKTCLMCSEIDRISPTGIAKNCKAAFQHGRALVKLGEFPRARMRLTQAQRLQPSNPEICKELQLLSELWTKTKTVEVGMWQRVFGSPGAKEVTPGAVEALSNQFAIITLDDLDGFEKNAKLRQLALPAGLTHEELNSVTDMIRGRPIELDVVQGKTKEYILRKVQKV